MRKSLGFTLLELLVVFSVVGVLAGAGFASFVSYSQKQVLDQAAADLKTGIDYAKFNAVSRVKPNSPPCNANTPLSQYRIRVCSPTVTCASNDDLYEINAACLVNGNLSWTTVLSSKKRSASLTATVSSSECGISSGTAMQFSVLQGIDAPCRMVLTNGSSSKTVCVDGGGNTTVKDGDVACNAAYLATTPVPTSPPISLIPTPTPLPDPPTIKSQSATSITAVSAVLNSTINPNRGSTKITYRWDTTNSTGNCSDLTQTLTGPTVSGSTDVLPNATNLSGLTGNTTYYYCATADNSSDGGGLTQGISTVVDGGDNLSFNFLTVPNVPTITSVGSPTLTSLTVSWTAPSGGATSYNLFYCDRTANSTCTPSSQIGGTISGGATSYLHNSGITCGRTYAYLLKAVNTSGSSAGSAIVTGATSWCDKPTVTTNNASILNATTAQLQSTVNPNNASTTVYYVYGTTYDSNCASLTGTTTPGVSVGAGNTNVSPNGSNVTLTPGTQYYYCAYATNSLGTNYGAVVNLSICYRDADNDTYGSSSVFGACGAGYVTNNNDCDDSTSAIIPGSTRTRYQAASVACGTACYSQVQTCGSGGVWSGTYSSTSCTASTRTAYQALTSSCGTYSYSSEGQTCQTSGAWSGTYTLTSPPSTATSYGCASSSVSCGYSCTCATKTCTSSGWSPNYPYSSCTVASGISCYQDSDNDGERASTTVVSTTCTSCPYGQTANTTYIDCYDGSNLANHSQIGWFNALSYPNGRGDNSWDFNCSGTGEMQYVGTSTLPFSGTNTCVSSMPGGTVGWQNSSNCPCGGLCTKRVCGAWSAAGCGGWNTAAVSYNFGASCYYGYASYAVGYDYVNYDPQGGNLYQACH